MKSICEPLPLCCLMPFMSGDFVELEVEAPSFCGRVLPLVIMSFDFEVAITYRL